MLTRLGLLTCCHRLTWSSPRCSDWSGIGTGRKIGRAVRSAAGRAGCL